jgi:hypothetical protein
MVPGEVLKDGLSFAEKSKNETSLNLSLNIYIDKISLALKLKEKTEVNLSEYAQNANSLNRNLHNRKIAECCLKDTQKPAQRFIHFQIPA